ncbi:MAG: translocation/assembly module TamB domain-containing protein [bacterium]
MIKSVYLEDQSQKKLLTIDQVDVSFRLRSILKEEKTIKNIELKNLVTNVEIDSAGTTNFQFIIDAFATEKKNPDTNLNLTIKSITLSNASIGYINNRNNQTPIGQDSIFDPNYILVKNLNTLLSFEMAEKNISLFVDHLNFRESSGLIVDNINTEISMVDNSITVPYLNIKLPNSNISLDSIEVSELNKIDVNINKSSIYLPDLRSLNSQLKYLTQPLTISTHLAINPKSIKTENIDIKYGEDISLAADVQLANFDSIANTDFNLQINQVKFDIKSVQDIVANFVQRPFIMPDEMHNLGNCSYTGSIVGNLSNLKLQGNLNTNIGAIKTDVALSSKDNFNEIFVDGAVESKRLKLGTLMPKSGLGDVIFTTQAKVNINPEQKYNGDVELIIDNITYNNYTYSNINIDGKMTPELFAGSILLDDENGYFSFVGELSDINNQKTINFTSSVKDLNLNKLNIIEQYPDLNLSFDLNSHLKGAKYENMIGHINIDSLLVNNGDKYYFLEQFSLLSFHNPEYSKFNINSDIINGDFMGNYAMSSLLDDILSSSIDEHLPMLSDIINIKEPKFENNLDFKFDIEPLEPLLSTLDIKWSTTGITTIKGAFNSKEKDLTARVFTESLTNGINKFDSIDFVANNHNAINMRITMATDLPAGHLNTGLSIGATGGVITTDVMWDNNNPEQLYSGEVVMKTRFIKEDNNFTINSSILPTNLILKNKDWYMKSSVVWSDFKMMGVDNFGLICADGQSITANGIASADSLDAISISLNDISLDYIHQMLPNSQISFGGLLSGKATVTQALSSLPHITADVTSERFVFDDAEVGNAHATCHFDLETSSIQFEGTITSEDNDTTGTLYGGYYLLKDSIDMVGRADGLNISFINYYIENIVGRVNGEAYADIYIHGCVKKKEVEIEVSGFADNASLKVDFLNTEYYFADSIYLNKNIIDFGEIDLTDKDGNKGVLSGAIHHNYYSNVKIDLGLRVDNMLVINTTKRDSESFYGVVYASGGVSITGNEEEVKIACKATTNNGSKVVIPIDSYYAADNTFITFVDHSAIVDESVTNKPKNPKSSKKTNVLLDLMLDMTPSTEVELIIDSKSGDMLSATGTGSIRVTYDVNAENINMYGNYQIEQGSYIFTFQNLLRKEFRIKEGSSILWAGDPLAATVNIDAYYQLTADLSEILDESVLANTTRTSVLVQCLLGLTGQLTTPTIKFDITLPNSDEELNRALEYSINTDELMNRQIIGLLLMGKFLSSESTNTNVVSQNELYSVVSSTLSSQLNNWASQMFDNWGFGINFRTSGEGELRSNEYEFNFLYTPTDKISINGNVGYRDDELSSTNFIGDFDLEYKLIESGRLKGKAYTHTNDYSEFKTGLTTQGVGLVYSESFNTLPELWQSWITNSRRGRERRREKRAERKERVQAIKQQTAETKSQKEIDAQSEIDADGEIDAANENDTKTESETEE